MTNSLHTNLPSGWKPALPFERCNFHWQAKAIYSYCGTPMCERCAQAGGLRLEHEHDYERGRVLSRVA